ncbi:MAG: protein kinase [Aridibacter famidurans]|nr:protein kinase [Aridibacter famidurans]
MLESGKVLQERYRVERQIGQGGMGSVYLATDTRFNSTVAVKETLIADDNFRKALMREARLLNSLKHVALPKVSDHFVEDNGQYIVMEYITGEDLYEMMERSGKAFPIGDVLVWTEQLLDALEYLHGQENPIIHRDIKPQNLKLTPQGQIILLDFGLAKGNPTDANHKTAANSIFGYSRHYASLEQIQGTGTDPRSDIYSLAATLYHLVTGKPPADALTRVMNVMNEERDPLQPANLIHEQVDDHFALALSQCMSLNANLRPQSAREMFELLFDEEKTIVPQQTRAVEDPSAISAFTTQITKVLPEGGAETSELRTKVMGRRASSDPAEAAANTEQAGAAATLIGTTASEGSFGRYRVMAAVGALVLLVAGTVVAFVYYGNWTGPARPAEAALPSANVSNEPADGEQGRAAAADPANAGRTDVPDQTAESAPETASAPASPRAPQATSGSGGNSTTVAVGPSAKELEELKALERELGTDMEWRFKDGKIFSESLIIDESGIVVRPVKPGQTPVRIPSTEEELRNLSPAQKRRIRNALEQRRLADERIRRMTVPKPVPPPPTPPPANSNQEP